MLLWLRKRKAHSVARKLLKSMRHHGDEHAVTEVKAPRWYFRHGIAISRDDRLHKMAARAARYIEQATGRDYRIEVMELLDDRVSVEAYLLHDGSIVPPFVPTPRSRASD